MSSELPSVNRLLRIDVGDGLGPYPSRVEDVRGADLLVAAPSYAGDLRELPPGSTCSLLWTGARGIHSVPVRYEDAERAGGVRLWRVRVIGAVRIEQRRRFARASVGVPMQLEVDGRADLLSGRMVDLGEGGVRARFGACTGLNPGDRVSVRFAIEDRLLALSGSILRILTRSPEGDDVVVVLDEDSAGSDRIRRYVLHQQMLARRAAR